MNAPATALDPVKQARFAESMRGVLNGAALALMTSIGHRSGLFDVMSRMPPATSAALAKAAGLDERYVREWLGAMFAGGVIEMREGDGAYVLPREHAALLTRDTPFRNWAACSQWIPALAALEERALACFERGGGVEAAAFPHLPARRCEFEPLAERVVPHVLELRESLEQGIDVLEVGVRDGAALQRWAARYPASRFTGVDADLEAVDAARLEARANGAARNVRFRELDLAESPPSAAFDCVLAFGSARGHPHPERLLRGIATALRPEGMLVMQDVAEPAAHPLAPFLYTLSCLHAQAISLAEGGEGAGSMWGTERTFEMLRIAGFRLMWEAPLAEDPTSLLFVARK